ncbi:MAG: MEDS domain-containing protein [Longimicrobiales bacterium]
MPRTEKSVPLGIRDMSAAVGDHIAYFWETPEEFDEAVGFLAAGIIQDEHSVIFGHDDANQSVCKALEAKGFSCDVLEAAGRLSILGPESTGELMLAQIESTFQRAVDAGAGMIRLLGNIGWGRPEWPDEHDILRFEAKVTGAAAMFPCIVICLYDIKLLSGSVLLHGAFGTHPLTIHQNLVRENPMCVGVEEYLEALEARRTGHATADR